MAGQAAYSAQIRALLATAGAVYARHGSPMGDLVAKVLGEIETDALEPQISEIGRAGDIRAVTQSGAESGDPVMRLLHPVVGQLPWNLAIARDLSGFDPDPYGVNELIAPDGPIVSDQIRFGFFFMGPDTDYPARCHAAEELYCLLSGTALWSLDGAPLTPRAPTAGSTFVHHPSYAPHATRTEAEPMFAMWAWAGNLDTGTYRMMEEKKRRLYPQTRSSAA